MSTRREKLMQSALTIFIRHGFGNATIQMIHDHSGVSKGTFYKFFSSKEDCFQAIFIERMEEDLEIRKTLEAKFYASDFQRLVDQIAIPLTSPEKERIWELFWTGFYSGEIRSTHLAGIQLDWLSEQFVQLYGEEIRSYASEGAVLCYGLLHQIAALWRHSHDRSPDWHQLVPKVLNYTEILMQAMSQRQEHIFDQKTLALLGQSRLDGEGLIDRKSIVERLNALDQKLRASGENSKVKELARGLLKLFQDDEEPGSAMIEVVVQALLHETERTTVHQEAQEIAKACWWYVEQKRIQ